jgi:hypothetical protein
VIVVRALDAVEAGGFPGVEVGALLVVEAGYIIDKYMLDAIVSNFPPWL